MSDSTHHEFASSSNGVPMVMTMNDLPSPKTRRWVARRKASVVAAVRSGLISLDEACLRYTLSVEEYLSWERAIERDGPGRGERQSIARNSQRHAERLQPAGGFTGAVPDQLENLLIDGDGRIGKQLGAVHHRTGRPDQIVAQACAKQ